MENGKTIDIRDARTARELAKAKASAPQESAGMPEALVRDVEQRASGILFRHADRRRVEDSAVRATMRALEDCEAIVKVGFEGSRLVLARRRKGDVIDDPECDALYETLDSGVYKRFDVLSGGKYGYRWMKLCGSLAEDIEESLRNLMKEMTEEELSSIAADAAFQSVMRKQRSSSPRPSM